MFIVPRKHVIVIPLLLVPTLLLATETRRVEVEVQVPLVTQVECPSSLELSPGETRWVTVRIACNQPWLFAVRTDNPLVGSAAPHAGSAGGMAARGHTFRVMVTCAAEANGPQSATLVTQLVSGPLVAGLPR